MGATEAERRFALGTLALLVRLVRVIGAIIVAITHELARNADGVAALKLEGTALPAIGMTAAVGLVRCVGTISSSITPLVFRDASSIVALSHSVHAFA